MKQFLIFIGLVFLMGCAGDNFTSLDGDAEQLPSGEANPHDDKIRALASEPKVIKIGNKKQLKINVSDTVGQNNLRTSTKSKAKVVVTLDSKHVVTQTVSGTSSEQTVSGVSESGEKTAQTTAEETAQAEVSFLIYMDNRKSRCVHNFNWYNKSFFKYMNAYDWEMGFSFYTDSSDLMLLQGFSNDPYNFGKMFKVEYKSILSKKEHADKALKLFDNTLSAHYGEETHETHKNFNPKHVSNPLKGIDNILQTHFADSSKKIVLLFGDKFPYNTAEEWAEFYKNNPDTSLFAISKRSSNVSNLKNILGSDYDFTYLPGCVSDSKEMMKSLIINIMKRLN